jgi:hypothetical protein
MRYSRAHAVAEGRKIAHRDFGGGLRFNAPGHFVANPVFGMHPSQALQVPPMTGPGGYTKPPDASTPPGAVMMAMQPQPGMAYGGEVDEKALSHARALLGQAKLATGGPVQDNMPTEIDGKIIDARRKTSTKEIWEAWRRLERKYPNAHSDAIFAMMLRTSPAVRYAFRDLTTQDYIRDGAKVTLRGGLEAINGGVK